MLLGVHLTLLVGPTVPLPAPPPLTEALQSIQVTHSDQGRSGFQMTFEVGRSGPTDLLDYKLLSIPLLRPFNRVILMVTFNAIPRVLMDGIITNHQLVPSNDPGASTLTVTGEDVSVMMDMEEKIVEHPAQPAPAIVAKIVASYAQYQLMPMIVPPPTLIPPNPLDGVPVQHETDLQYLGTLAEPYGYVFYIIPGPLPSANVAYWGPPVRAGLPQRALSVNMGANTNVASISFQHNALAPTFVSGQVQDAKTNVTMPVQTFMSTRLPLVSQPAIPFNYPNIRTTLLQASNGLSFAEAYVQAQGVTDKSMDEVVSASGELDATRYGDLLQPRALAGLRGVGYSYDGLYYVKSVTHSISKGEYKQSFSLTREGLGSITPAVIP